MKILVVEDEIHIAEAIKELLTKEKHTVDLAHSGYDGYYEAVNGVYDLIILDVMLPEIGGFEVTTKLRKSKNFTPILFLTARDTIKDKVHGLDIGGDDYLSKPFNADELLARVRVLGRRHQEVIADELLFEDLKLNLSSFDLHCNDHFIHLSQKEFDILSYFLKNQNSILSKEDILSKAWGYYSDAEFNHVEVYISFIRKKLQNLNSKVIIETIRGIGYRLGVQNAE